MNRKHSPLKSKPIGFVIIAACILIVLALAVSFILATFSSFKTGINGAVSVQTRELSTQIVYNYENYIASIIKTSTIIQTDISPLSTTKEWRAYSDYLKEIIHLNSDIVKIAVYEYETRRCLSSSDDGEIGKSLDDDDVNWFSEAANDPTVHVFPIPYSETGGDVYKVNVSKRIKLQDGTAGILKIEISFQSFIELVGKSNLGEGGHITIIDPNYDIVYTSLPEYEPAREEIAVVREIILGTQNAVLNGYVMTINVDTLSNTKWRICVFINIGELTKIERDFLFATIIVSIIVLVAGILMFMAVARAITKPMKQLELAMRKVEKSDYFRIEEVNLSASKEVEALIRRLNKMMLKINDLMKRVIVEQNAQRKSELKALQNQINPHFLYNTLDSIIWLIENEKNEAARELVVTLARLFRIGISNDNEVIPVRDEIEHVRSYLLIQNIRYSDSFDYEFELDENAMDALTMKLVLQPIVENCIYHGLKNNIDRGKIRICARTEGDYLILSVSDNGYGMRQDAVDALYASFKDGVVSNSVGLKNIYQRVMIYYGGNAEMKIESELDEGTTITIKEPLNKNEKKNSLLD